MAVLVVLVGPPGAGKTTFAAAAARKGVPVEAHDAVAAHAREAWWGPAIGRWLRRLEGHLARGESVIADSAASCAAPVRDRLRSLAGRYGATLLAVVFEDAVLAVRRNAERPPMTRVADGEMRLLVEWFASAGAAALAAEGFEVVRR